MIVTLRFTEGVTIAFTQASVFAAGEASLERVHLSSLSLLKAECCNDNNAHEKHCNELVGHSLNLLMCMRVKFFLFFYAWLFLFFFSVPLTMA